MSIHYDDGYCCEPERGQCCGPGSWCCQRAGDHGHTRLNTEENGSMESWGVFRKDDGARVRPDITFRSEDRALRFVDVFVQGRSEFEARKL